MAEQSQPLSTRSTPLLWGDLAAGPFAVGFQSFVFHDYSRRYEIPRTEDNLSHSTVVGRPIVMQVWYPAEPLTGTVPMFYQTYLKASSSDPLLHAFVEQLNQFTWATVCREEMQQHWADLAPEEAIAFQRFLELPTACYLDAPPLPGQYPAVIYHQGLGGSIVDNPVLLEFLASHGYVVATSAYQPEHGLSFGVNSDLDRSVNDVRVILNRLCEQYAVDSTRIGLMGHSFGASAVLACAAEAQANIHAVVSLDSTREWDATYDHLFHKIEARLSQAEQFTVPLMIWSQATPTQSFQHYDKLRYADRYEVTVKHLKHNDFVTPGPTTATIAKEQMDDSEALIRSTSKVVCESSLAFFDVYLKRQDQVQDRLIDTLQAIDRAYHVLSIQAHRAESLPITPKQLLETFLIQGVESGCQQVIQASAEVGPEELMKVGYPLQERGRYEAAIALYQCINQQFPDFARAYESLGNIYYSNHDEPLLTQRAYQAALEALPRDTTLSELEQAYRRQYLTERIQDLT